MKRISKGNKLAVLQIFQKCAKGSIFSKGFAILVSTANFALNFLQNKYICISRRWYSLRKSRNFEFAKNFVKIWLLKTFHLKTWILIEIKLPLLSAQDEIFLSPSICALFFCIWRNWKCANLLSRFFHLYTSRIFHHLLIAVLAWSFFKFNLWATWLNSHERKKWLGKAKKGNQ